MNARAASTMASLKSAKSTTDGGSSDGSRTSAHLRDRDPSESSLSSRADSLVDSQVRLACCYLIHDKCGRMGLKNLPLLDDAFNCDFVLCRQAVVIQPQEAA